MMNEIRRRSPFIIHHSYFILHKAKCRFTAKTYWESPT